MIAKFFKRTLCATLACACVVGTSVSLSACSVSDVHIVIGVQENTGSTYQSMKNLLDALSKELDFSYETVLVGTDANSALTSFQNAMLAGASGVISMVDLDAATTKTLIKYCEDYDAYYSGYMIDFANIYSNTTSTDAANVEYVLNSDRMLGTVTDGDRASDGGLRGEFLFKALVDDITSGEVGYVTNSEGKKEVKVTFAQSPAYAFPVSQVAVEKFKELAEEWNSCPENEYKITWYENSGGSSLNGVYVMNFSDTEVPPATVQKWAENDVQAVVAMNSLGTKLLSNVQKYGKGMVIYQVGYEDTTLAAFPDTIKTLSKTPAETIIYPLILILNAVHGCTYSDQPTDKTQTAITGNYLYITSKDEFDSLWNKTMSLSDDYSAEHSLITVEEVKALLAENGGTFEKLTETIASWTTDKILSKKSS